MWQCAASTNEGVNQLADDLAMLFPTRMEELSQLADDDMAMLLVTG